jgi:hypothetical protein
MVTIPSYIITNITTEKLILQEPTMLQLNPHYWKRSKAYQIKHAVMLMLII